MMFKIVNVTCVTQEKRKIHLNSTTSCSSWEPKRLVSNKAKTKI
jgi:hypothetical protein